MKPATIIRLRLISHELRSYLLAGSKAKQLEAKLGHSVCRLGDEAMAKYSACADAIDALTASFPDYQQEIENGGGDVREFLNASDDEDHHLAKMLNMTRDELAS